jgi:hypothetical protein
MHQRGGREPRPIARRSPYLEAVATSWVSRERASRAGLWRRGSAIVVAFFGACRGDVPPSAKYQLHQDAKLFEKAYGYVKQYY